MNLLAMKTALKRYAGLSDSDPLVDWINDALHDFEDAYPWPFLEGRADQPTVTNDDTLTLPSDFFQAIKLRVVTNKMPLRYLGIIGFEDEIDDPTKTGEPHTYTLVGMDEAILYPVPDAVYTVRVLYRKLLEDLVNDGDIPQIPSKYHYTIVKGAAVRALQAENEEERADTALGIYNDAIAKAIQAFGEKQQGSFGQVRDTQGYGEI